jgi:hypothetical protein
MDPDLANFTEAHNQLIARDRELLQLGRQIVDLLAARMPGGVPSSFPALQRTRHETLIRELRVALAEQTAWAQQSAEDVVKHEHAIGHLQNVLAEQVAHAEAARAELEQLVFELRASLEQQAASVSALADELVRRDNTIRDLQIALTFAKSDTHQSTR